jgi:hypothetical protein
MYSEDDEDDLVIMEYNMFENMVDDEIEHLSTPTGRVLMFLDGVLQARYLMHHMVHKFGEVRVPLNSDYHANLPICKYLDKRTNEIVFKAVSDRDLKKPN